MRLVRRVDGIAIVKAATAGTAEVATGARQDTVARGWTHRREDQCTRAAVEDHLDASCITVKVEGVMESATKPA